ncbi:MAG: ThiF family adenylyltransferase [Ignavibacteriaceae bacterium]|nr:ThiF family adenylyltransferase [Ignavibacteriaceae bacterium]
MNIGFHSENFKAFKHFGIADESGIPTKKIAVALQREFKDNQNAQDTFILCCNLLTRLFLNIDFIIPFGTLLSSKYGEKQLLCDYVLKSSTLIFPEGNFHCNTELQEKYDGVLLIGNYTDCASDIVSIMSNGWNVFINKDNIISDNLNPIAACAASCFGTAELFKHVANPACSKICTEMSFSLLTYDTTPINKNPIFPKEIDIGDVTLVGVVAIGSSIIYTLKCIENIQGKLSLIDRDFYEDTNLNRYVIADHTSIGKSKVFNAKEILNPLVNLDVIPINKIFDEYIKEKPRIDTLITAVDKRITRFNIQSFLPKLIIDAATTGSIIDLARVDFGTNGACLGCLYLPEKNDDLLYAYISESTGINIERVKYLFDRSEGLSIDDIDIISNKQGKDLSSWIDSPIDSLYAHEFCGSGKIASKSNPTENLWAPVSFISALAGILVTCELIKDRYFKDFKVNNHFLIDTLKLPNPKLHNYKMRNEKCPYCNDGVFVSVYKEKWAE